MYRELIENQLERVMKAKTGGAEYDYASSIEALALLLPEYLTVKAFEYRRNSSESMDDWLRHIKNLMISEDVYRFND